MSRVGQNVIIILGVIYNVTVYNVIYLGPPPLSLFVIQRYTNYITLYNGNFDRPSDKCSVRYELSCMGSAKGGSRKGT